MSMTTKQNEFVALVSGGSRGLGLGIVRAMAAKGFRVATFSRRATDDLEHAMEEYPGQITFRTGDLGDNGSLEEVVKTVEAEDGPINVLINNAAIARDGIFAIMRPDDVEQVVRVNLTGTLLLTQLVIRRMMLRKRGNIVTISSIVGIRGYRGLAAYAATKAGLQAATRALARELGSLHIRVNAVVPGYLETEMTDALDREHMNQIVRRTPLGRLGTPADVTGAVLFLISDDADFITGQSIVIDGGITC